MSVAESPLRVEESAAAAPARRGRPLPLAWLVLAGLLLASAVAVLRFGRETTFYFDEWNFVLERREWNLGALLEPHNEHLSLVPVFAFKLLLSTVGADTYLPYRLLGIAASCLVAVLMFLYARRRVGDWLALGCAALLLFLGAGWIDLLWPFQIGFLGSLAAGLGALLALDRGRDVLAAALLAVALASSSLGIPLLAAAAVELLGGPERRRRWWVIAAPAALYALWYVIYSEGGQGFTFDNLLASPGYVAQAAAGATAAVSGLGIEFGRIFLVAGVAALVWRAWRFETVPWRLAALVALPLVFWGLTALARAQINEPTAPRYLYPGALFVLLIAVEAARRPYAPRRALALLGVLLAASLVSNIGALRSGGATLRDISTQVRGALAATEIAADRVDPQFQPEPGGAPQVRAGLYLDAVRDVGSPVRREGGLERDYAAARASADGTLLRAYGVTLVPGSAPVAEQPPVVEQADGVQAEPRGGCLRLPPSGPGASVTLVVPPGGLSVSAKGKTDVALRRFGDGFPSSPVGSATGSADSVLRIPPDRSRVPWRARLSVDGPARVCALS